MGNIDYGKKHTGNDLLKILALITMLIDHVGYALLPEMLFLRVIGRLAFPIFAYQIAIGYSKTSNLKKYVQRMFIFALITQIPYSFFNPYLEFRPFHFNVLFMFLAAMAVLYTYNLGISSIKDFMKNKNPLKIILAIVFFILTIAIAIAPEVIGFFAHNFSFEYGFLGIVLVLVFYIFRDKPTGAIIGTLVLYFIYAYYECAISFSNENLKLFMYNIRDFKFTLGQLVNKENYYNYRLLGVYINSLGVVALIPIYLLQRIKWSKIRLNKFVGYIFYPAHITIIILIKIFIIG